MGFYSGFYGVFIGFFMGFYSGFYGVFIGFYEKMTFEGFVLDRRICFFSTFAG